MATTDPQPTTPTTLGPYRLEALLGEGGMGQVYRAYDTRLGRRVAMKRVRPDAEGDAERQARFRREARAAARLRHANIVRIYDVLETDQGDWIVMELLEGTSLAERLAAGPLDVARALELGEQVARGLDRAHQEGVIHRDLKAENVVVDRDGSAKVLDFGLAKLGAPRDAGETSQSTLGGALVGTYRAMSPEQVRGFDVDATSDLFALGVLLYEMLTGRSPFLASSPVETLDRVCHAEPVPVREHRGEVPPEISELVERLLDKEPHRRPPSAATVAEELARQRSALGSPAAGPARNDPAPAERDWLERETHIDAVTEPPPPNEFLRSASSTYSPLGEGRRSRRRASRRLAALVVTALAVASILVGGAWWQARSAPPLRVAVLAPEVAGAADSEPLDRIASGVVTATLRTLVELDGLSAFDPTETRGLEGSPSAAARAVAADEALTATVEGEGDVAWVSLRRIGSGPKRGETIWAERFQVPTSPVESLMVANAVASQLRRAYAGYRPRGGAPAFEARGEDYAEMIAIKARLDRGERLGAAELERLDRLVESSPRFLDAYLIAATLANSLYKDSRDPEYLERATRWSDRARSLAPNQPQVLGVDIRLALGRGDTERARRALDELERRVPGDRLVPLYRSHLAESAGDLEMAIAQMRAAVARLPSWRDLYRLAKLERRGGRVDDARVHLVELLKRSPQNRWGLSELAQLELLSGDLDRAEALFLELIEIAPHRSFLTNLGLVRLLLRRNEEAAASFRRALELDPGHRNVLLNLADAELALGHDDKAAELYRRVLGELEDRQASLALSGVEQTTRAQCLARLGFFDRAVDAVTMALERHSQEAEVAYQAALVYALAGHTDAALEQARRARQLGIRPRWLTLPGFDALHGNPQFRRLLETAP